MYDIRKGDRSISKYAPREGFSVRVGEGRNDRLRPYKRSTNVVGREGWDTEVGSCGGGQGSHL